MVTDEELEKLVKQLYKERQRNPPLEEKSDEELKQIAMEAKEKKKALREERDAVSVRFWTLKGKIRDLDLLQRKALTIKGRRKGKDCPAKKTTSRSAYGATFPECEARKGWQHFYIDDGLYEKYCSTCKLSPETIEKRVTFKRVFETREGK